MSPSIHHVKLVASRLFDMSLVDLEGASRQPKHSLPRQAAMVAARRLTGKSLPAIGRSFRRDHTTVLHAINRADKLEPMIEAIVGEFPPAGTAEPADERDVVGELLATLAARITPSVLEAALAALPGVLETAKVEAPASAPTPAPVLVKISADPPAVRELVSAARRLEQARFSQFEAAAIDGVIKALASWRTAKRNTIQTGDHHGH